MKLVLQRSISPGPFWIETARVEESRLRGFLVVEKGLESYFEPRYDPYGELYYLSNKGPRVRLYQHEQPGSLTHKETLRFAFSGDGLLATLKCEGDGPFGVAVEEEPLQLLDSSAVHLGFQPGSERLVVLTLESLYVDGQPVEPIPASRFTLGPDELIYGHDGALWSRPLEGGEPKQLAGVPDGDLEYPCWTPEGIFVTQTAPARNALWHIHDGRCEKIWQCAGAEERLYICDFRC